MKVLEPQVKNPALTKTLRAHFQKENKMSQVDTKVRVEYTHKKRIMKQWDEAINNAFFTFGLIQIGSGFNFLTGVRDLSFRPETEQEFCEIHG